MTNDKAQRAWAIRAGKGGKAHDLFLDKGVIALEHAGLGSLKKLDGTRDAFCTAYRELHPDETRTGSAGIGGKFFRFVHEVKVGDLVVYPALPDKMVYVGQVTDTYRFDKSSKYPHQRSVKWKYVIPKSEFSRTAQYELGAARTFFEFKKNTPELFAKMKDRSITKFRSKLKPTTRKKAE